MVHKLIVLCMCQQKVEFVRLITVDRYVLPIASRMYMWDHTVVQTKSWFCVHQVRIFQFYSTTLVIIVD